MLEVLFWFSLGFAIFSIMIMYISYCQGKQDLNYACIDRNTLKVEKPAFWDNLENSSQTLY